MDWKAGHDVQETNPYAAYDVDKKPPSPEMEMPCGKNTGTPPPGGDALRNDVRGHHEDDARADHGSESSGGSQEEQSVELQDLEAVNVEDFVR